MSKYVKKEHPQNNGGRPKKIIDQRQFEGLCKIQCTKLEICEVLDVDDKTLENWCRETYKSGFSEVFARKRQGGKASLRRKQFEIALAGNVTMLIFLGKNHLGQSDKVESTIRQEQVIDMGEHEIT